MADKMEYRYLGNSGLRVSVLSLGSWLTWGSQISDDVAFECVKAALDAGCNFLDNAEVYAAGKAEETMGRVLKRLDVDRSELVISTKIFWAGPKVNQRGLSRKHIIEGTERSLKRLQLDYVDVIFAHRPDPATPMEEIVRSFSYLIDNGKAFYWGTSEWPASQIIQAHEIAKRLGLIGPIVEQPQYNMMSRTRFEKEYAPLYKDIKLGTTIWSPLASGLLTGKYSKQSIDKEGRLAAEGTKSNAKWLKDQIDSGKSLNGLEEKDLESLFAKVEKLKPIAEKLNCTLAQLGLAWCVKNPNVSTVITGASKASQVTENFKALEVVPKLTTEIMEEIEAVLQNKPEPERIWK